MPKRVVDEADVAVAGLLALAVGALPGQVLGETVSDGAYWSWGGAVAGALLAVRRLRRGSRRGRRV